MVFIARYMDFYKNTYILYRLFCFIVWNGLTD